MASNKEELEQKIYKIVGYKFNILSAKQLAKAIYEDVGVPVRDRTSAGNPSTNEEALKKLASDYKVVEYVLEYKKILKLSTVSSTGNSSEANKIEISESSTLQENTVKIPKPGMPQPRQVLENDPNADLVNYLNKDTSEILKEESEISKTVENEKNNLDSHSSTQVSVAMEIESPEFANNQSRLNVYTSFESEQNNNYQRTDNEQKISSSDNITSGDFEEQSKTENESKSINSASSFNLSEEQKNNFAIIKNKSEHHTVSKSTKSSFSFDEETKENEFSQNSMVMNVKQTSDQNDQNNVSIFKSKALISALIIFVLLLIVIGVIFTNSLNSIN